ncbi:unnamed protein product [Caenorhabditis sp. 36 PRJEB53466]|nr:unnamed protein product [Caenorhabditis sp. 36 PRJEB53466]
MDSSALMGIRISKNFHYDSFPSEGLVGDGFEMNHNLHWSLSMNSTERQLPLACHVYPRVTFTWDNPFVQKYTGQMFIGVSGAKNATKWFELTHSGQIVVVEMETEAENGPWMCHLDLCLTPIPSKMTAPMTTNFLKTHLTDVILNVGGYHLHVNKQLLSVHSEWFRLVFASMSPTVKALPININPAEKFHFAQVLSLIHPFPALEINAFNIDILLRLASSFKIPAAIKYLETLLLSEPIDGTLKIVLADKYGLQTLMRKSFGRLSGLERIEKLLGDSRFDLLSANTKEIIFQKFLEFRQ